MANGAKMCVLRTFALCGLVAVAIACSAPATAQSIQNVESLPQSVRSLIEKGHYAEAQDAAEALLRATRGIGDALREGAATDLLVEALTRNGRGAEPRTREFAEQIVRARTETVGPDNPLLATSLRNLGDVLFQAGDYRLAAEDMLALAPLL